MYWLVVCVVRYDSDAGHRGSPPMLLLLRWWEGNHPCVGSTRVCWIDKCDILDCTSLKYIQKKNIVTFISRDESKKKNCFPNSLGGGRLVPWTWLCSRDSFTDLSTMKTTKKLCSSSSRNWLIWLFIEKQTTWFYTFVDINGTFMFSQWFFILNNLIIKNFNLAV